MTASTAVAPDVALIGAGIMGATLAVFLKELEPSLEIAMFETLEDCALESSGAWNNAGTGHAANCELNYTPERPDGSVDISRALEVNVEFDISRQAWLSKLGEIIPSYGVSLIEDAAFTRRVRAETAKVLEIENV